MQPQKPPPSHRQEPQWHTSPPTLADIGYEFRRLGRGLRGIGRDIWTLGIQGVPRDLQRFQAFLQQPPRWFFILLVTLGIFIDMMFALSLGGELASQARWLRSLMP